MLNLLSFGATVEIQIVLDTDGREHAVKGQHHQERVPVYVDGDSLSGSVVIGIKREGRLEHQGIRIELCGITELYADRGSLDEFLCIKQDLARPGILSQKTVYPFEFMKAPMPFESYHGTHVHLRYFLRVIVNKRWGQLTKECPIMVHCPSPYTSTIDEGDKMEVGIEESLHVEIEYNKQKYHLNEVIVGQVCFLLVHVKVKNMELQIIKREIIGSGLNCFSDSEILAKYEIMDGAPVRGEWIPIRLFLGNYPLSPTFRDVNRKFSVRYYLNLVILDEEERRYYKQQEILLYRVQCLPDGIRRSCIGDSVGTEKSDSTAELQASTMLASSDQVTAQVRSDVNGNSAKDNCTSRLEDRPSVSCRNEGENVDEVEEIEVEAMTPDVLSNTLGREADEDENSNPRTSDTDLQSAENLIVIEKDDRETVAVLPDREASPVEAGSTNSSDIDEGVVEREEQGH